MAAVRTSAAQRLKEAHREIAQEQLFVAAAGVHLLKSVIEDIGELAVALLHGDADTLAAYRGAPGMPYAHPTVEHLSPLFVTLGAATDPSAPLDATIDGYWMGLSKRSLQVA